MYVSEVMTTRVSSLSPEDTAAKAADIMSCENIGAVPVVEQGEIQGILTDRDIVLRCVAQGKDPKTIKAREIMSKSAVCVTPVHTVDDVVRIMSREQIRRLPVVDNGKLTGMVSMADIARIRQGLEAADAICEISKP